MILIPFPFFFGQVLLKPIVSQLSIEPPISLEEHPNLPSVKEVDDLLAICIGQMAVTAGSDLLWKPLNHEVLLGSLLVYITIIAYSFNSLFLSFMIIVDLIVSLKASSNYLPF